MRRMSAGMPGAVCPGLFAEKVIEWLYWDIPQFGVLRSRTLLARAQALSCYANVARASWSLLVRLASNRG